MDVPLKRYRKEFAHSYAFGVFPTLELLDARPADALGVLLHSRAQASEGGTRLREVCAAQGVALEVNDRAIERLTPNESHHAVGVFAKNRRPLERDASQVVLVNPADMGNLGTIARTLLGFGLDQLAIIRPAADWFDPRTVRAAMGAVFRLACQEFADFDAYRAAFPGQRLYPLMTTGRAPLAGARFEEPCALIFGNESSGLPDAFHDLGASLRIPTVGPIDSLSLPVSVGIALYEFVRQRS